MNDTFDSNNEAKETKYVLLKPETTPIYNHLDQTDDEIDLFELLSVIYKKKWLIICVTLLSLIVASLYCIYAKKVYEVKYSFFVKPYNMAIINDWDELINNNNNNNNNNNKIYLDSYLNEIIDKKLDSIKHEKKFIDRFKINKKKLYSQSIDNSNEKLSKYFKSISIPKKQKKNIVFRSCENIDTAQKILNQYMEFSEDEIKQEVVKEQTSIIDSKLLAFEEELKLNKQKEQELNKSLTNKKIDNYSANFYIDKTNVLALRNNQLLIDIKKLKKLKSELDKTQVFEVDYIDIPEKPIKPKTKIVIVVAFMLSFCISIFYVLFLNVLQNRKELNLKG